MKRIASVLSLTAALGAAACTKPAQKTTDTTPARNGSGSLAGNGQNGGKGDGSDGSGKGLSCDEYKVHFAFNSVELTAGDKSALEQTATCLKDRAGLRVTIEGNADERGTDEYNLALGESRAQVVARYLELLGASRDRIKTVSFGKDNPICNEQTEDCWAQNRRAAVKPSSK